MNVSARYDRTNNLAVVCPGDKPNSASTSNTSLIKPALADTIKVNVYADNCFMLYINGKLVAVDPIDFLPHNVVTLDILPEFPMTIAVMAPDNTILFRTKIEKPS